MVCSGGDGIPVELFQILKDDAVKVLHSYASTFGKHQWPQDWKRSVFIPIPKKGNGKECSNYCTIVLISHASKIMLKFSKLGFNSTWTVNFQMFKLDLKGRGTRDQIANTHWIIEKVREFQKKHPLLLYWLCQSLWLLGTQQTVENSSRDGNTRPPDLPPEKPKCRSRSNS